MHSSILTLLIAGTLAFSSQCLASGKANERPIVECRSKKVWDAGYSMQVFHECGVYSGFVNEETFAGNGHQYYRGRFTITKINSLEKNICRFQLSDAQGGARKNFDIRLSSDGSGLILKLEGKSVPQTRDSFVILECLFDVHFLKQFACLN